MFKFGMLRTFFFMILSLKLKKEKVICETYNKIGKNMKIFSDY